jgi:hypothetical protein
MAMSDSARKALRALALGLIWIAGMRRRRVPLWVLLVVRRVIPLDNAVVPRMRRERALGQHVRNETLAALLLDVELGGWTLPPATIDLLELAVRRTRPEVVLEFGSGISTVCLAHFMKELHRDSDWPLVVSIEEAPSFAEDTIALLERLEYSDAATVIATPIQKQRVGEFVTHCYEWPIDELKEKLAGRRVGLVLVDGPSLPSGGSRFGTIVLARDMLSEGALVFLDDARRDAELAVAARWRHLEWLEIRGVNLVGQGVLEAVVRRDAASAHGHRHR